MDILGTPWAFQWPQGSLFQILAAPLEGLYLLFPSLHFLPRPPCLRLDFFDLVMFNNQYLSLPRHPFATHTDVSHTLEPSLPLALKANFRFVV